ncbi:BTAD domain-containing putative transcriptional regulator [Actinokineospora sp. 24-640]
MADARAGGLDSPQPGPGARRCEIESTTSTGAASFRILGPVEVVGAAGRVPIPPGRQQVVLACLLLDANQVVSTEYLVDTLWDDRPPDTARTQVQICVSRLRKSLGDAGVDAPITTRPPGYLMRVDPDLVDVHLFTRRVSRARELVRADQPADATALLRSAVELWRGPCLSGLGNRGLRTRALRLDEEHLSAIEACLELELGLGRHRQLVGEISTLVRVHPLRERLRAQLMLALYRSGRQAEALDSYREGRDLLIDELGLEPGEDLRALEAAILAGEPTQASGRPPAPAPPPPPPPPRAQVPRQLPADTADFIADEDLLREAESVLVGGGRAVGVVVIVGRPGVGKSTLAAHIGHRLAEEHFPDGQLYCDLRGTRAEPSAALEVLGRFLTALGIPGSVIPATLDGRIDMYRTLLATKRVLVVLDDAVTESQVVPLLPGSSTCAVLVTTRSRLTGVPGARQIELDVLDQDRSLDLLGRVIGGPRVAAEPEAAAALVRTVGGLPLALRIIAARLAARPHWTLASMVHRLASERHRLDELAHGEMTIRASLSLTHDGLDARTRRLFALLSLAEGPTLPGWLAGAAVDDDRPFPSDLLEPLVDVQMLDVAAVEPTGEFRYRYQDIIRLFAREQVTAEHGSDGAVRRMLGGWLSLAGQAHQRIYGGDYTRLIGTAERWNPPAAYAEQVLGEPMDWLDGEQANLCAAVAHAARAGLDEQAWELAVTLATLFESRGYLDDWKTTHDVALAATRAAGNTRGTAALLGSLGTLHINRGRPVESRRALEAALALFGELDDPLGLALCRRDLGLLTRQGGDDDGAMALYALSIADFDRAGDVVGRAIVLTQSAHILMRRDRTEAAHAQLEEAIEIYRAVGYSGGIAHSLRRVGQVQSLWGDHEQALGTMLEVLDMVRRSRDVIGEGYLLRNLGEVSAAAGRDEQARRHFVDAIEVRERIMDLAGAAEIRLDLASVLIRLGEAGSARAMVERAAAVFRERGMERELVEAARRLATLSMVSV